MSINLLIFDLDNTIYDWYSSFIPAFYRMIETAAIILDISEACLIREIQRVHILHGDVEHPFSLLETDVVRMRMEKQNSSFSVQDLDPAFHEFNKVRKQNLKLFPYVRETLEIVRANGFQVIAHTDARFFGALGRLSRLGVGDYFDYIYCRERDISRVPMRYIRNDRTSAYLHKVIELPSHETKPSAHILTRIISNHRTSISSTAYVGDSPSKDMLMAKRVGCSAIWAKYGSLIDPDMYEKLVKISHWTEQDIAIERALRQESKSIQPDFTCEESIFELLGYLESNNPSLSAHLRRF